MVMCWICDDGEVHQSSKQKYMQIDNQLLINYITKSSVIYLLLGSHDKYI